MEPFGAGVYGPSGHFYGTFGHYVNPPLSCLVPVDTLHSILIIGEKPPLGK